MPVRALRRQFRKITCIALMLVFIMQGLSFAWYMNSIESSNEAALESLLTTKCNVVDSYLHDWRRVADSICYQDSVQELMRVGAYDWLDDTKLKDMVESLVRSMSLTKGEILNVDLFDENGTFIAGSGNGVSQSQYVELSKSEPGTAWFSGVMTNTSMYSVSTPLMYYFAPVRNSDSPGFGELLGTLAITFNMNGISSLLKEEGSGESQFLLLDGADVIIAAARRQLLNDAAPEYLRVNSGKLFELESFDRNGYVMRTADISGTDWTMVAISPRYEYVQGMSYIFIYNMAMLAMGLALMAVMYYAANKRVVSDVNGIIQLISSAERIGMISDVSLTFIEFQTIADTYCQMANEHRRLESALNRSVQLSHEREMQAKQWELDALRNQLQPHFLYNTLEHMRGMALYYGARELNQQIAELSRLLRYSMQPGVLSTVGQEIEALEHYIRIIEKRSGSDRIAINLDWDAGLRDVPLPRLLLQPLVENAVEHGLSSQLEGGRVDVTVAYIEGGTRARLCVADNGKGMDDSACAALRDRLRAGERDGGEAGIGLASISRCLRLTYGERATLDISSVSGQGTSVVITLDIGE